MKKLLLATSILAATTGYAAAEVSLTGDARMGVVYDGENVQFSERARVRFNLSGQTDTGLEFGATFRADQANQSANGGAFGQTTDKRGTVWISGAFGKLSMGDVNSAAEEAFGDLTAVGFSGLNDYSDIPYIAGDASSNLDQGPGALYSYTVGGFEFHVGMTDGNAPSTSGFTGAPDHGFADVREGADRDTTYSLAAAYAADNYKIGIGYLNNGKNTTADGGPNAYGGEQIIIVGETDVAGFGLKAYYSTFDDYYSLRNVNGDFVGLDKSYGLNVDYTFGATTVTGFARRDKFESSVADINSNFDTFGIGAIYDLGGGATLRGGVVNTDRLGTITSTQNGAVTGFDKGETIADVGIRLNF